MLADFIIWVDFFFNQTIYLAIVTPGAFGRKGGTGANHFVIQARSTMKCLGKNSNHEILQTPTRCHFRGPGCPVWREAAWHTGRTEVWNQAFAQIPARR